MTLTMIGRELLMLVTLAGLGSAPALLLPRVVDGTARAMLLPILGIGVGGSLFTTLVYFLPTSETSWIVPVTFAASVGAFVWVLRRRNRSAGSAPTPAARRREVLIAVAQIIFVCVAVAGPITYTFAVRDSVGPVGYAVGDAQGYVATIDGMQRESIMTAGNLEHSPAYASNLTQKYWSDYGSGFQELDITPLSANLGSLFGLAGTEIQSPFLIALMVTGALGACAVVRSVTPRRKWVAPIAGAFLAGAFFLQLFFDGSEGALVGIAVIGPLLFVAWHAIRDPRVPNLVATALLGAALVEMYPLFVPAIACLLAIVFAVLALRSRARGTWRSSLPQGILRVLAAVGLVAVLNLEAADRSVRYWYQILHGAFIHQGLPDYDFLTPRWLPSWLLQLQEFYTIGVHKTVFDSLALNLFLPLIVIGVILVALRRYPLAWLMGGGILIAIAIATYERSSNSCSYCEDRNLLPIVPLAMILMGIGFATLLASKDRRVQLVTGLMGVAVLVGAVHVAYSSLIRFRDAAYFLDDAARQALAHLPSGSVVELEGFNEGPTPTTEQGVIYMLAEEDDWDRVSLPGDSDEGGSNIYIGDGFLPLTAPQFMPKYEYVLTREPDVATHRQVIFRDGGIALEKRTGKLDVTPDYGLSVTYARDNPYGWAFGNSYNVEPIKFVISGSVPGKVYLNIRVVKAVTSLVKTTTPNETGAKISTHGITELVCVPTLGSAPTRTAYVQFKPAYDVQLKTMAATTTSCNS